MQHVLDRSTESPQLWRRSRWRYWLILFLTAILAFVTCGIAALILVYRGLCPGTPCVDLEKLKTYTPAEATRVYDRNGVEIATFSYQHRRQIPLSKMPPHLIQAFLAIEDRRFYEHHGVDPIRVAGAMVANLRARNFAQGFSTITMQLARNVYPDVLPMTDRSIARKLREIRIALEIETVFDKDLILERYLNTIFLGAGAYGVEAASRIYFGKSATELTLDEAALLAALPKAPSRYNPYRDLEAARRRRNLVLDAIHEAGYAPEAAVAAAKEAPIRLAHTTPEEANSVRVGHHFVEAVRQELAARFGEALYRDGLTVRTTLDAALQARVDSIVRAQLERIEAGEEGPFRPPEEGRLEAATIVMDVESGDVLAYVGGRDFEESRFDRVRQARRQPGSAFKPFVYAAAIAHGFMPYDSISDAPITIEQSNGETWTPRNFDESGSEASVLTLLQALQLSRNRATVRLAQMIGLEEVARTAEQAGLGENLPRVPALVLGAGEVSLAELASAYTVFARSDGKRVLPRMVLEVRDRNGDVLYQAESETRPSMDPEVAKTVRWMLEKAVDAGTGTRVRTVGYQGSVAGKTGTTNNSTDVWFIGVTPRYAAGVWIGFDVPATILNGAAGTGGRLAAPVWGMLMQALPAGPDSAWTDPEIPAPFVPQDSFAPAPDSASLKRQNGLCLLDPAFFANPDTVRSFLVPCPEGSSPGSLIRPQP